MATETPASRATSFMVAMTVPVVGKRLHSSSVTENARRFKRIALHNAAKVNNCGRKYDEKRRIQTFGYTLRRAVAFVCWRAFATG
ncbi:hypothetical protein E2R62_11020 [Citrobacter rodentium]|uniref:Uncharacterized protein n=1 Tax=Citrobacter rodentium TaxID=67825 RepID=A0A482PFQ5_CITRO|nr:hypothetical protein E2R62_11020 [Citrobacter rodentium]